MQFWAVTVCSCWGDPKSSFTAEPPQTLMRLGAVQNNRENEFLLRDLWWILSCMYFSEILWCLREFVQKTLCSSFAAGAEARSWRWCPILDVCPVKGCVWQHRGRDGRDHLAGVGCSRVLPSGWAQSCATANSAVPTHLAVLNTGALGASEGWRWLGTAPEPCETPDVWHSKRCGEGWVLRFLIQAHKIWSMPPPCACALGYSLCCVVSCCGSVSLLARGWGTSSGAELGFCSTCGCWSWLTVVQELGRHQCLELQGKREDLEYF